MDTCLVSCTEQYSKLDFFLFRYFGIKRLFKKMKKSCGGINLFYIPIHEKMKESYKEKYFQSVCRYLRGQGIKEVCFDTIKDTLLQESLKKEFQIVSGVYIFYTLFQDILQFLVKKRGFKLHECEIAFISNKPEQVEKYLLKCIKTVKSICVFTTDPARFESLVQKTRDTYGLFLKVHGKKEKVKKYNKIYINLEEFRIFDKAFFKYVHCLDIYNVYESAYNDVLLHYKTEADDFLKKNKIKKNLCFTDYLIKTGFIFKQNHNKIVNIRKI